eukprot:Gb_08509 [translate_table: standard]
MVERAYVGLAWMPDNVCRSKHYKAAVSLHLISGCSSNLWNYLLSYVVQGQDTLSSLASRSQNDLLGTLEPVGTFSDGRQYNVNAIQEVIGRVIGELLEIRCNKNMEGEEQLLELFVCVDKFGASTVIPGPILPLKRCHPRVLFPPFRIGI